MRLLPGAALLLALAGCPSRAPVPMEDVRALDGPRQQTWDLDLVFSEGGRARFRMRAPYAATYARGDSSWMNLSGVDGRGRVQGTVYGPEGDSTASVEADRMTWREEERVMEALGRVVVRARNGRVLESEQLLWLERAREVRTDGFARVELEDGRLEGYGLRADETLADVRMANVTGNVRVIDE